MDGSKRPAAAASTSLLNRVIDTSMDPGYRSVSQSKPAHESQSARVLWKVVALVAAASLMWGATVAARSLYSATAGVEPPAETLASQVEQSVAVVERIKAETEELTHIVETNSEELIPARASEAVGTAATRVQGPGIVLTITDSFGGGGGLIQDSDMRTLLNALWAGGAEAIAVNGSRIGPQTTVRTAGASILVNLQPIASPYAIEAIGDVETMSASLTTGSASKAVRNLEVALGMNVKTTPSSNLILGPQVPSPLFYAQPTGSMGLDDLAGGDQ